MERSSIGEYLNDFLTKGNECAYVEREGYRTIRWSYRQIAETAFRFHANSKPDRFKKVTLS